MIEIRLPKQRLLLKEAELLELLKLQPHLWERALARGKAATRNEKEIDRYHGRRIER